MRYRSGRNGIREKTSGNGEVRAVVLHNQSGDVLPDASPDGDVAFHVIGTVVQQASEGSCMFKVGAVAECVGCCSERFGNVHAFTSLRFTVTVRSVAARWCARP